MENTPTGCADDLPTILGTFKKWSKLEKCKQFSPAVVFYPKQYILFFYQPMLSPLNPILMSFESWESSSQIWVSMCSNALYSLF